MPSRASVSTWPARASSAPTTSADTNRGSGNRYKRGRWRAFGNAQFFRWLRAGGNVNDGYATYYDEIDPFQGRSRNLSAFATIQPNSRLSEQIEWQYVDFDRADTGADVYDVVIINSRTTYQFTRRLYARLIAQHDTSSQRLLLDSLVSYELRPGTVFFAGYGALRERRTLPGWRVAGGRAQPAARVTARPLPQGQLPAQVLGITHGRRRLRSRRAPPGWPPPSDWAPAGRSRVA